MLPTTYHFSMSLRLKEKVQLTLPDAKAFETCAQTRLVLFWHHCCAFSESTHLLDIFPDYAGRSRYRGKAGR